MLAVVQEHFPKHRAVTNGLYMGLNFVLQPVATVAIGIMGDHWGLPTTFLVSGAIALLSIPVVTALPNVNE
jgi:MFS family permease